MRKKAKVFLIILITSGMIVLIKILFINGQENDQNAKSRRSNSKLFSSSPDKKINYKLNSIKKPQNANDNNEINSAKPITSFDQVSFYIEPTFLRYIPSLKKGSTFFYHNVIKINNTQKKDILVLRTTKKYMPLIRLEYKFRDNLEKEIISTSAMIANQLIIILPLDKLNQINKIIAPFKGKVIKKIEDMGLFGIEFPILDTEDTYEQVRLKLLSTKDVKNVAPNNLAISR